MFIASYPASFLPESNGKGLHVRFPDLPEALTGGDDLADTFAQASDCLAEALAGRIVRGDEIPLPSKAKRGQHLISVPLYLSSAEIGFVSCNAGARHTKHGACEAPRCERNSGSAHVESEARHQTGEDSGRTGGDGQADRCYIRRCRVIFGYLPYAVEPATSNLGDWDSVWFHPDFQTIRSNRKPG